MSEIVNTEFIDKTGRAIYVGDIVQHRLGKFGKSGGSHNLRVTVFGKGYHLVDESDSDERFGGMKMTQKICENLVVIKSDHMRL